MRADRLLSILLLLQVHRRITARELARRLEVSERTIYRDMEALSSAGIPVTAERGTGGGWLLLEAYQTNLTGLNQEEIQALFLTRPSHLLTDLGLRQASEAALIKLLAVLPSLSRRDAENAHQRIYVDVTGWHHVEENVAFLPTLYEAICKERKLQITYRRNDNVEVERVVSPLGLVAKGSTWYLVASVEEDQRTYRVSRFLAVNIMEEPCIRPADFDLVTYWNRSSTDFVSQLPRYPVTVRMEAELLDMIYQAGRYARIQRIERPGDDGRIIVHLLFEMEQSALGYLISFGPRVEIIEPQDLREKVIALAESVLALYTRSPVLVGQA
ncbi:YafY family transcriptional regulator [Ktedonosporobacter rubrisoli]|uniref:YafY family transcriptional regulator n=1 Tax=Ktedonosporobacter rubrisoli TaxID=2509675 RepID=A0A4P6JZG8_KTERU|nr:YafY family protein [Ktedonosporobacter rubrisoli]QBD80506.1 YafY family transcriptional regulator [Ktedonosporobacter rubrisoli]